MGWLFFACVIAIQVSMYIQALPPEVEKGDDISRFKAVIYQQSQILVQNHNSQPTVTYKLQLNQFATLTLDEISQIYLGLIPSFPPSLQKAQEILAKSKQTIETTMYSENISPTTLTVTSRSLEIDASTSSLMSVPVISERTVASTARSFTMKNPQPDSSTQILNRVRKYFQDKNLPVEQIKNYLSSTETNSNEPQKNQSRLLQSTNSTENGFLGGGGKFIGSGTIPPAEINDETLNQTGYDVDWSCLAGRVKMQGKCGSCYAYSAVDTVASLIAIYQYGFHVDLSVQEIIDCPKTNLTFGCYGGFLQGVLAYIATTGILTQHTYPFATFYTPNFQRTCQNRKSKVVRQYISDFRQIPINNCRDLKTQLMVQPISIGIAITRLTSLYGSGVFNGCRPDDQLNHAVTLVQYKVGKGWKIKNSWGTSWGENGYAWLAPGNTCRICEIAFYPVPKVPRAYQNFLLRKKMVQCPPSD